MTVTRRKIEPDKLARAAEVLKAIAHPVRLSVLERLQEREPLSVSELMEQTDIEQSLLSHHLAKLKDKGVLQAFRSGKHIYYQLADRHILKIFACLDGCDFL